MHEILAHELGSSLPRPTLVRIERTSAGNPLFVLERFGNDTLRGIALGVSAMVDWFLGHPPDWTRIDLALALEDPNLQIAMPMRSSLIAGTMLVQSDDFARAQSILEKTSASGPSTAVRRASFRWSTFSWPCFPGTAAWAEGSVIDRGDGCPLALQVAVRIAANFVCVPERKTADARIDPECPIGPTRLLMINLQRWCGS